MYLEYGVQGLGLRPFDDGPYRYHGIGIEHLAFEVDRADEVDKAYERCIAAGGKIQSPPERHYVRGWRGLLRVLRIRSRRHQNRSVRLAQLALPYGLTHSAGHGSSRGAHDCADGPHDERV